MNQREGVRQDSQPNQLSSAMNLKIAIKFGVIMGVSFCVYSTIMWLSQLDTTYLYIGRYLDMAIVLMPIAIIFLGVRAAMQTGRVSFLKRILLAVCIGLVSFVIYAPFLFVYHNYINPTWFDAVLALRESQMAASQVEGVTIAAELQRLREFNQTQSGILNGFIPSVVVLPILIALISLPIIRNRKVAV